MYRLISRFVVAPEHQAEFIDAVREDRESSLRDEPGTRRLDLIRDRSNPSCFYLDEEYIDEEAFAAHAKGRWFRRFFVRIIGKVEERPLLRPDRLRGGLSGGLGRLSVSLRARRRPP